ncbi:MAG: NUDIX domain-containing protein [Candidatus Yonathbacteria bacterium]|nr:NUDIX domain-containing protein [Candidatus Yonathbacteria bacterium]
MDFIPNQELHRITSTAIIHRDGKYLILKRSPHKKTFPSKWTVPGGGLETDDYTKTPKTTTDHWYYAIERSLRREVKEECGLETGRLDYLLDMTFIRPDGIPVIVLSYYGSYVSGEVVLDEDSVEYAWVTCEEAKGYDLIDGIWEEIEMVDRILNGETEVELNLKK